MRHLRVRLLLVLLVFAVAGGSGLAQEIPDSTPPVITSGPTPSLVAFTTANILWTTDEPSGGRLELARSPDDPQPLVVHFENVLLVSFPVTLSSLTQGTTYYVRVVLWDQYGNGPTISPWVSFRTLGEDPPRPPVITSGPTPSHIGFTTGDIVWTTDEPSGGRLELARSTDDPQPAVVHFEGVFLASWQVTLSGLLTPHTTYYARVVLWDQYGNGPTISPWVSFRTLGDDPPTANAGPDQSIAYGQPVTLDGSGSFDDNTPTSALQFQWMLSRKPHDSLALLSNPHIMSPTFVADFPGLYEASLTVIDNGRQSSLPDTVQISSINLAPTADVGNPVSGYVGGVVTFDGTASRDPESGSLSYEWEVMSRPGGSTAALDDPQSPTPSLFPDLAGEYRLQLVVRDQWGLLSAPAETSAMIVTASQYAESLVVSAQQQVSALPGASTVINEGHRTALNEFLTNALRASARGDAESVRRDLESALLRVDGCALRGAADGAGPDLDWISGCAEQVPIYERLAEALTLLR